MERDRGETPRIIYMSTPPSPLLFELNYEDIEGNNRRESLSINFNVGTILPFAQNNPCRVTQLTLQVAQQDQDSASVVEWLTRVLKRIRYVNF